MYTIGQHIARTTVSSAVPAGCAFFRPDGGEAAQTGARRAASPSAARSLALATVGSPANPVRLADGGAVRVTGDGALLSVSRGTLVVTVRVNQQSSLEATEIARQALSALPA